MFRKALTYGAILTGVYLGLAHATAGGQLIGSGASAIRTVATTFQGR